jgi:hypothetical protein
MAFHVLSPRRQQLLVGALFLGMAAGISCSILTSPSDYQQGAGGSGVGIGGGTGGTPVDAGPDVDLPENVALRVFVVGGDRDGIDDFSNNTTDVWVGDIADDGTFGPWRTTSPLIYGGRFGTAVTFGKLFAVGRSPTVESSDRYIVLAAPFDATGVSEWSGVTDTDKNYDNEIVTQLAGEFAYAVGGIYSYTNDAGSQTGYEDDVLVTRLVEDASAVLPWTTAEHLNQGRRSPAVLVVSDYLFVIAGRRGSGTRLASVEASKMNLTDGSLQPFITMNPLGDMDGDGGTTEHPVVWPTACSHGNDIYVIGGETGAGPSLEVWRASFDAGTEMLSAWTVDAALPRGLYGASCLVHGDTLYLLGGVGASARSDEVMASVIAADGSLGEWAVLDAKLPYGRSDFSVTAIAPI